jgi:hypothetical protein
LLSEPCDIPLIVATFDFHALSSERLLPVSTSELSAREMAAISRATSD